MTAPADLAQYLLNSTVGAPQSRLLSRRRRGEAAWTASHFDITAAALEDELASPSA